jgi:LacI family transcriptional regulator
LAVPDLTNPFFPEFAQGVHTAASANGYAVFLLDGHSSEQVEIEGVNRLADRVPEGLIWCPVGDDILSDASFRFPSVVYDRVIEGFDSVCSDIRGGGELQAKALIDHGHTRVGLLTGPLTSDTARLRRQGFVQGLGTNAELVWEVELDYVDAIPPDIAKQIIGHSDVTGAATANDIQAIKLMSLYRSAGIAVPDDVSVIGFDDIDLASLVSPPLATVRLSPRKLGERSFEVLVDRIKNPDSPIVRERLSVDFAERGSLATSRRL